MVTRNQALPQKEALDFCVVKVILIIDMKVRFNRQITVDFYEKGDDEPFSKTFYSGAVVEVVDFEDNDKYLDLQLTEGVAVDVPRESLTIL